MLDQGEGLRADGFRGSRDMGSLGALDEEGMLGRTLVMSHTYTHNTIYTYVYICVHIHMYIYLYLYTRLRIHLCTYIRVYTITCVDVFSIYMYIYIYKLPLFSLPCCQDPKPSPCWLLVGNAGIYSLHNTLHNTYVIYSLLPY